MFAAGRSWMRRLAVGKTRVGNPHYDAKDLYFPIPKVEMENNPNMTQSIGYENE